MRSLALWTRFLYSLLSLQFITRIADAWGQWEWLGKMLNDFPILASIVRGPLFPLICLVFMVLLVEGQKYLERPRIISRFANSKIVPDLTTTTLGQAFAADSQSKPAGWDRIELTWLWFVEIKLANESATPVTIDGAQARVICRSEKWSWLPIRFKTLPAIHVRNFREYKLDHAGGLGLHNEEVANLLDKIAGVPLTQGTSHGGWLCFKTVANQIDLNNGVAIDIWLIDAFDNRQKVNYKRNNDKSWDSTVTIFLVH